MHNYLYKLCIFYFFRHVLHNESAFMLKQVYLILIWGDKRAYFELFHKSRLINIKSIKILTRYYLIYNGICRIFNICVYEILVTSFQIIFNYLKWIVLCLHESQVGPSSILFLSVISFDFINTSFINLGFGKKVSLSFGI